MLTPQELQDKKFAKAVFGGYDMGEVDEFLDQVVADYEKLFKESAILKAKLKTLAEKVEEYRSVDEEMRRTLASAKRTAEEQVAAAAASAEATRAEADKYAADTRADADAYSEKLLAEARAGAQELATRSKKASENMLETARAEAMGKLGGLREQIEAEQARLDAARAEVRRYSAAVAELLKRQMATVRELAVESAPAEKPAVPAATAPAAAKAEIDVPFDPKPVEEPKTVEPTDAFDAPAEAAFAEDASAAFDEAFAEREAKPAVDEPTRPFTPVGDVEIFDEGGDTRRIPVEEIRITERHAADTSVSAASAAAEPTVRFEAIRRVDLGGETIEIDDDASDDDVFRDFFGGGSSEQ